MFGLYKRKDNKVIEQFESSPIYTLDDIMDSDTYLRLSRDQLQNILDRLNRLEQPTSINLVVPTLSVADGVKLASVKELNKPRKKK